MKYMMWKPRKIIVVHVQYLLVTLVGISIEDHRLLAFGDCAYPAFTRGVGAAAGVIYSIYPPNTILSICCK